MNGIIEYDQKLTSLPRFLLICQLSPKKNYWNIIFIFTLIYYTAMTSALLYLFPPKYIDIIVIVVYFIPLEFVTDLSVIFSSYFFLKQLEYRFKMLNYSWKYLQPGFLNISSELTDSITEMTLDKMRLLHAELSDLLRIFSDGYGKVILGFFVLTYIDMLVIFFFMINSHKNTKEKNILTSVVQTFLPYCYQLNNVICILSIVIAASRVHEKKRKMISHLRLIRISNLSAKLKLQVKLFMNQITVLESSEITDFGVFNINLNLVVSILILLVTGFVTIIQMQEHPTLIQSGKNFYNMFLQNLSDTRIE
ncbi:uncharacterized protein LOC114120347 [Aphis gossypii]|uniref:uncharacterized protein LOC114120347 n=1 Tax=Aphis gossypii TaxID=80765 RepID=UPI00100FFD13|nr:uncharacterized protein LOC114120347 [Aphis gossypii]XP_050058337.1 uncharacterized protein LOC114120347 [Aphis gossypii]